MTYSDLKEKHGERLLSRAATDIVLTGIRGLKEHLERDPEYPEEKSALERELISLIDDINSGSWDEVRAVIKRSL